MANKKYCQENFEKVAESKKFYTKNNEIILNFEMNTNSNFSYIVTDLYGKIISEKAINNLSNGNHSETIELPSLSSGVYFIAIHINNERKAIKLIKQ